MTEAAGNSKLPHIYVLLFAFIAATAVATYIVPAGSYDRVPGPNGGTLIDPDSYHRVEQSPITLLEFFVAIPQGFVEAAWVVVLTFCVGGAFMVVRNTGAIEVGVSALVRSLGSKGSILIIPVLMTVFATIDAFIGMPELCMVYVPILVPLILALGYDSITAVAIALCGSAAGFTAALTNPFTVALAQEIAGLPLYSGLKFRIVVLVVTLAIGIAFVLRYALKVQKNPTSSQVYASDAKKKTSLTFHHQLRATLRQKLAGAAAISIFIILVFGVLKFKWGMMEMGGLFVAMAVISGTLGGLSGKEISESFNQGCRDVLMGALIVGIARGITVVMTEGQILDTTIHVLAQALEGLPGPVMASGMLVVQSLFNFLVPSGSGQTLITMPIMAPLSDLVGVTRQTAVLALQYGDGISNIFYPTSGFFMASLALGGVPWEKWAKFMLPLFLIWSVTGCIFLIIAQAIQWGPF